MMGFELNRAGLNDVNCNTSAAFYTFTEAMTSYQSSIDVHGLDRCVLLQFTIVSSEGIALIFLELNFFYCMMGGAQNLYCIALCSVAFLICILQCYYDVEPLFNYNQLIIVLKSEGNPRTMCFKAVIAVRAF